MPVKEKNLKCNPADDKCPSGYVCHKVSKECIQDKRRSCDPVDNPCGMGWVCYPGTNKCMRRNDPDPGFKKYMELKYKKDQKIVDDKIHKKPHKPTTKGSGLTHWESATSEPMRPGQKGFNKFTREMLIDKQFDKGTITCDFKKKTKTKKAINQRYQSILQALCHPSTPIDRLLVQWQLGTGKTMGMLRILENYFQDERPKLLFFPTEKTVINFYEFLAVQPNKYKQAYEKITKKTLTGKKWYDLLKWCEDVRRIKAHKDARDLIAPVRAFAYAQAGGSFLRNNSILNWHGRGSYVSKKTLDGTIVLADEAHNMVSPGDQFKNPLQRTGMVESGRMIKKAKGMVTALFTATPIVKEGMTDFFELMSIVTGEKVTKESLSNGELEGYISSYMQRPGDVFPETLPDANDIPKQVTCTLKGEILREYVSRRFFKSGKLPKKKVDKGEGYILNPITGNFVKKTPANEKKIEEALAKGKSADVKGKLICLEGDCLFGDKRSKECAQTLQGYENQIRHTKNLITTDASVEDMMQLATKLTTIAESIAKRSLKTIVIMHKSSGMDAFRVLLDRMGMSDKVRFLYPPPTGEKKKEKEARKEKDGAIIEQFNADNNVKGTKLRALVLSAEEYTEGVSFMGVRRIVFPDVSPDAASPSWAMLKQRIGRAVRLCSHKIHDGKKWVLDPDEQKVEIELYVSSLPGDGAMLMDEIPELTPAMADVISTAPTIDEAKIEFIIKDREVFESQMSTIERASIEYGL